MQRPPRFVAPVAALLCVVLTSACLFQPAADPTPDPSALAAAEAAKLAAYNAAICPVFDAIVELDPRLAALRSAGANRMAEGVDPGEVDDVIGDLGGLLDDLEAVPDWEAGRSLRYQVITALHAIRARLLLIADSPTTDESLDHLAELPFIASQAMDLAYNQAFEAGHRCEDAS
jgi:hypothetical protein